MRDDQLQAQEEAVQKLQLKVAEAGKAVAASEANSAEAEAAMAKVHEESRSVLWQA